MNHKSQPNNSSLIGSMKVLLVVALAVFLLSTAATQIVGIPVSGVSAASSTVSERTPSTANPSSKTSIEVSAPLPTPESTTTNPTEPSQIPTTTVASTPSPAGAPIRQLTYTVRHGDTLAAIAQAHGLTFDSLVAANKLADPNLLYIGQILSIPNNSGTPVGSSAASPTMTPTEPAPGAMPVSPEPISKERWIDVDLSDQRLAAYEGSTPVHSFLVSTGLPATPTPVGQFRIWIKLRYDDMAGADYYIEDVPFVMYFHEGYGLHGVTWHGNFGYPMSHGCVNLPTEEAEWLFGFAEVGTLVNVHE